MGRPGQTVIPGLGGLNDKGYCDLEIKGGHGFCEGRESHSPKAGAPVKGTILGRGG